MQYSSEAAQVSKLTIVVGMPGSGRTTYIKSCDRLSRAVRSPKGHINQEVIALLKSYIHFVSDDADFLQPQFP